MELENIWQEILNDFRKGNKLEALKNAQQAYDKIEDPIFKWRLGFIIVSILIDLNKTSDAKNAFQSLSEIETILPIDFQQSDEYSGRLMQLETMFLYIQHDKDTTDQLRNCVDRIEASEISIYHSPARINMIFILYRLKEFELMETVLQNINDKPILGGTFSVTLVKTIRSLMLGKPVDKLLETLVHTADTPFARWALYQRLKIILDEKGIDLYSVSPVSEAHSIIK